MINIFNYFKMNKIHHTFCMQDFKKKKYSVETQTQLIFLMQLDYISKKNKPLYKMKTYIKGNTIKIEYLSDLLVMLDINDGNELKYTYATSFGALLSQKYPKETFLYKNGTKFYRPYEKLSAAKINELALEKIKTINFNNKLFINDDYKSKKYYGLIRRRSNVAEAKRSLRWFYFCAYTIPIVYLFLLIDSTFTYIFTDSVLLPIVLFNTKGHIILIVSSVIALLMAKYFSKPTPYELKNKTASDYL